MKFLSLATVVASFAFSGVSSTLLPFDECGGEGIEPKACPSGYVCEDAHTGVGYWQCLPEDHQLHEFDTLVRNEHELRKRQTDTSVRGPSVGKNQRLPIQVLQSQRASIFNMFVIGLWQVMRVSETGGNLFSYYELAGIHGRPVKPWAESPPSNPQPLGYCTHGSALFATWHRPYLSLIEQRIHAHAMAVAARFTGSSAAAWRDAATRVRLPYFDWAASDLRSSVPAVLQQAQIQITYPATNGVPFTATINNPLYAYRFTSTRKNSDFPSASIRSASMTLRQPPQSMTSSNNAAFDQVMRNSYTSRRQNTYNLFAITNFNQFSNRAWNGGSPSSFVSLESIHDEVHVAAGGNYGHMTYVEYSAFDPVFWLHHCMIDRLLAMYQGARPGLVVQPQQMSPTYRRPYVSGQQDTIDTPLYPFRKSSGQYYTSRDVSAAGSIWNLNYAYPEVPVEYQGRSAAELQSFVRSRVQAMYGPSSGSAKREISYLDDQTAQPRREWVCFIKFNTKEIYGNMQILFFLGDIPKNPADRKAAAIGSASGFSPDNMVGKDVTATVPLTELLLQKGSGLDMKSAVKYLKLNFRWCIIKDDQEVDAKTLPSLFIGVSSTEAKYVDHLPVFGEWEHSVDITEKLPGGFTKADDPYVEGNIAQPVPVSTPVSAPVVTPAPTPEVPSDKKPDIISKIVDKGGEHKDDKKGEDKGNDGEDSD